MTSHSFPSIEKLDGTNYYTWKFQMEMILREKRVWDFVNGTEAKPDVGSKSKSKDGEADPVVAWEEKNEKAFTAISLAIHSSQVVHVRNTRSSAEAWRKLEEAYETKGVSRRLYLR